MAKSLSRKEKYKLKKQKEKLNKKIIKYSIFIIFLLSFFILLGKSIINTTHFINPKVDLNLLPGKPIHWHIKLKILINNKSIKIPNNLGLSIKSTTHTHDEGNGIIHIENSNPKNNPETMSLGYFFNLWKKPFNKTCILNNCIGKNNGKLEMFVNGKQNFQFQNYVFKKNDKLILIKYTSNKS